MKGFECSGRMSVDRFEQEFYDAFGVRCDILTENGELADQSASLASLRPTDFKGPRSVEFSLKANMLVGNVCSKFEESFGIPLRIYQQYVADRSITLSAAKAILNSENNTDSLLPDSAENSVETEKDVSKTINRDDLGWDMEVIFAEFFLTGPQPDEGAGDQGSEFGIYNYFLPRLSLKIIEREIFVLNGVAYLEESDLYAAFEAAASNAFSIGGVKPSGEFFYDVVSTTIDQDNIQESVLDHLGDIDFEFFSDTDYLSEEYASRFGCRVWLTDVDGLARIEVSDGAVIEKFKDDSYMDVDDYMHQHEDTIQKTIAVLDRSI